MGQRGLLGIVLIAVVLGFALYAVSQIIN